MANKLTKNDIERVLPTLEKDKAIEQTERYMAEYENSKKEFEELMRRMREILNEEV